MSRTAAPNLTQGAYEELRAELLSCRILPGSRLKNQELCERFSVSVGAIREALSRLTAEGLVVAEPQRGFKAAEISVADLQDLTMVRIEIESLCLRRSIAVGGLDWESRLVAAYHRLSRMPERAPADHSRTNDDWAEAHAGFHAALVGGCDSPWLLRLQSLLYAQSERYRRLSMPLARTARDVDGEHKEILAAALAHDVDRATDLLARHMGATTRILLEAETTSPSLPGLGEDREALRQEA
jgi:DNA-binding GntR family transcriptional regulator